MDLIPQHLRETFVLGFNDLQSFQFSFANPVFWVFIGALFLLLLKIWDIKKSFSFSAVVAAILLLTTALEKFFANTLSQPGEPLETVVIRFVSAVVIGIIFIIYLFIIQQDS
ncbi:MAG: hypothetical protein WC532_00840 [Candidatus Omnitrophota bacterium]